MQKLEGWLNSLDELYKLLKKKQQAVEGGLPENSVGDQYGEKGPI